MLYLDHHASQPILPSVQECMIAAMGDTGNPSSVHLFGQKMRNRIENVREKLAEMVGLPNGRVIFTSGATEANNLVIAGHQGVVFASNTEHPATLGLVAAEHHLPVDNMGVLDLVQLDQRLSSVDDGLSIMVSVMYANNETGVVQPISKISQIVHQYGGILHVDAVQGFGRADLDMRILGIDVMTVSGHKIGGPPAIGAVIAPQALPLRAQIIGGGQERGLRGGTENWLGIIGFGAALEWLSDNQADYIAHLQKLDQHLARLLVASSAKIVAASAKHIAGCSLLVASGYEAQNILMQLDMAGIAVSSGSACSSGTVSDSHVLRAMGICPKLRASAIRVSFGNGNSLADVEQFCSAYLAIVS